MRRCTTIVPAFLVCLHLGCIPGVSWLPDSSGFVYTSAKGELVIYDIATKKRRVILKDAAAATTCWPAISPKGKRIALAHLHESNDKKNALIQIVVCDQQGKIEFRSNKLSFALLDGKDYEYATQIVWSPDEKKLLVHGQGHPNQGYGFDNAALFDTTTKKMQIWDKHIPAYFGGTPNRPDGAGFLLGKVESKTEVDEYVFVDWTGKRQTIVGSKRNPDDPDALPAYTGLLNSRWDGAKAVITFTSERIVIDTQKRTQTKVAIAKAEATIGDESIQMRAKLDNGPELLLLQRDDGNVRGPAMRVAARKPGDPALTEVLPVIRDRKVLLSPAPNGKHAIVRVTFGYRGSKGDRIYVLDDAGGVHNTINVRNELEKD